MPTKTSRVRKQTRKHSRSDQVSKGQRSKDEKSILSLDRMIEEQGYNLNSTLKQPPEIEEEGWKVAIQGIDALAKKSIESKCRSASQNSARSTKADLTTVMNLMLGLDNIKVNCESEVAQDEKPPNGGAHSTLTSAEASNETADEIEI